VPAGTGPAEWVLDMNRRVVTPESGCVYPGCAYGNTSFPVTLHKCSQCPRKLHHMCCTNAAISEEYRNLDPPAAWCYMCIPATGRVNVLPASTQHGSMQEVVESAPTVVDLTRDPCVHGFTLMADRMGRRQPQARVRPCCIWHKIACVCMCVHICASVAVLLCYQLRECCCVAVLPFACVAVLPYMCKHVVFRL
jgi:hypothetical protein